MRNKKRKKRVRVRSELFLQFLQCFSFVCDDTYILEEKKVIQMWLTVEAMDAAPCCVDEALFSAIFSLSFSLSLVHNKEEKTLWGV